MHLIMRRGSRNQTVKFEEVEMLDGTPGRINTLCWNKFGWSVRFVSVQVNLYDHTSVFWRRPLC
jgi:hypothetical protein